MWKINKKITILFIPLLFGLFLVASSTSEKTTSTKDVISIHSTIGQLKTENREILETAEDVKSPRINFQIDLKTKEDAENIDRILSLMDYEDWSLSIFTTVNFAKENEGFIKSLDERGYEIGLLLEESILELSYEEQLEIIDSSSSYLSSLIKAPILHLRIKEYTVEFKDIGDLLRALQELEFESITAHFLVDKTFPCWQCADLGFIVHPMHVGYAEVVAVPIGYLPEDNVLLVDELIFQNSTSEEFLYYLLLKYNETTVSKLPFVVILHPSTMASDETRLDALDEFLTHVKETDGELVDTSFMAQIANQYMSGLTAEPGTEILCPGKKLTIKGKFTTTKSCPTYYISVYGKYLGQIMWKHLGQYSCAYPDCRVGTYDYSIPITIPEPPKGESKLQIWVLGRGCWPTTPGCGFPYLLPTPVLGPPWVRWKSITEREVQFSLVNDVLTIKEIKIEGLRDPNNPETTQGVRYTAELSDNTGATVSWDVAPKRRMTMSPHGRGRPIKNRKGNGRVWTDAAPNPPIDTHGEKTVTAKVTWKQGEQECKVEKQKDYILFFRKTVRDYPGADFGGPNWYGYWSIHDDSATPSWDHSSPTYTYGGQVGRRWALYNGNRANPTYTIYDRGATDCSPIDHAPAGIDLNGIKGIHCLEVALEHERWHRIVDNRNAGGIWNGLTDTDGDEIPDVYESGQQLTDGLNLSAIGFDPRSGRSFPGFCCGDDEEVFNTILAQNERGTRENDWANRGKQSDPSYLREVVENGTNASLIGNYSDFGIDIDADGLYDFLAISAQVDVVSAGTYTLMGKLLDNKSNVQGDFNFSYLNPGINNVILLFNGETIRRNRIDGPFILTDVVLFTKFSEDEGNQTGNYTTSFYNYKQFEQPRAEIIGAVSESAIDTNDNSLYDRLDVTVRVNVTQAGNYALIGHLTGNEMIISAGNSSYFGIGEQNVILSFDGLTIRAHRENGPYNLKIIEVLDQNNNQTDIIDDTYNTSSYLYTQFEKPSIEFTGIFSDYGVDTDVNDLFDILRIQAEVDAEAGNYTFSAHLSDINDTEITYNYTDVMLTSGTQSITLGLDGSAIGSHGIDGPYKLTSLTLHDSDGVMLSAEVDHHNTSYYTYTQFEKRGGIIGRVLAYNTTPLENVTIFLSGEASLVTQSNSNGNYSFKGLKPGNYSLFVISSDINLKTNYSTVSLAKGQTLVVDFVLAQAGSISGYVVRVDGTPVPNVTLYWEEYEPPRFVSDENGSYLMPSLDNGTYILHADPPPETDLLSRIKTVEVVLGETTIANFTLIRGANITGIVTDVNGTPVASAYVSVSGPSYGYDYTNSTGGYLITMLRTGNYTVTADPPYGSNLLSNSTTVEIVTEETVSADIILPWGPGRLEPYLIEPTVPTNVLQNEFFSFSSGVRCMNGVCGNVTATLDPVIGRYSYNIVPTNFIDISTTGVDSGIVGDDSSATFGIAFNFTFYENTYDSVLVGSNGYMTFGTYGTDYSNDDIPSTLEPNDYIAPFWDDLDPSTGGVIYYETRGVQPNRKFIVQWDNVAHYGGTTDGVTFEAILYENSSQIEFQYQDVSFNDSAWDNGTSATVGVENQDGGVGTKFSYNSPSLYGGLGILFEPIIVKGVVPINSGSPFYTIDDNPQLCIDVGFGEECNQTWQVNATGDLNTTWEFFTTYESETYPQIASNETDKINITISSVIDSDGDGVPDDVDNCPTVYNPAIAWGKPITITEQSGSNLTDYQVLVTVDTESLISAGKMREDCGDIRFKNLTNSELSYWVESGCNTTNTRIWVEVPFIPPCANITIYMYYGNLSSNSTSSNSTSTSSSIQKLGPKVDNLLIRIYSDTDAEYAALKVGDIDLMSSPLTRDQYEDATGDPSIELDPLLKFDMFEFDLNNNETIPTYPGVIPSPTSYVEFRHALAHLVDKDRIVDEILQGYGIKMNTPIVNWSEWYYPGVDSHPYDPVKAAEILDRAGFVQGTTPNPYYNSSKPGSAEFIRVYPPGHSKAGIDLDPLVFYVVTNDPLKVAAGRMFLNELRVAGIPVDLKYQVQRGSFPPVMMEHDYHLYTGDWLLEKDPTWMFDLYHSRGSMNYNQINDTELDTKLENLRYATNKLGAEISCDNSQVRFQEIIPTIPLWSTDSYQAHRIGWKNTINEVGKGVDSWWTFLAAYNVDPGVDTIRYGLSYDVIMLNPIYSYWRDWFVLDKIYDTLIKYNPYTLEDMPSLAYSWDVGTWFNPETSEDDTKLTFYLLDNVTWHDLENFTCEDVNFTIEYIKQFPDSPLYSRVMDVHHVECPDPRTAIVYMDVTSIWALHQIGKLPIIPKHIFKNITDPTGYIPGDRPAEEVLIGTGPWKYFDHLAGDYVHLVANPDYFFHDPSVSIGEEEPIQADADDDDLGNACDNCWYVANPDQNDTNNNCPSPPYESDPQCGDACEVALLTIMIELPENFTDPTNTSVGYYFKEKVPLNFTVEPDPDWIGYSLNLAGNVTITGNTTMTGMIDASLNDVTVFANDTSGNQASDERYFYYCLGDITGAEGQPDWKVDGRDLFVVARAFGSYPGHPFWNPDADLNMDGKVDGRDIFIVSRNYGKACY